MTLVSLSLSPYVCLLSWQSSAQHIGSVFGPVYGLALGDPEFPLMFSRLECWEMYSHRTLNDSMRLFAVLCLLRYNMSCFKLERFALQGDSPPRGRMGFYVHYGWNYTCLTALFWCCH
jgi:hypothetical protein